MNMQPSVSSAGSPLPDLAISSWEASKIMGLHYTMPQRYAEERGWIKIRRLSSNRDEGKKGLSVYSLADCERSFQEYILKNQHRRRSRPRKNTGLRDQVLAGLRAESTHILFGDAVGVAEAAAILGVTENWVPKMIKQGAIVGRQLPNGRGGRKTNRGWAVSRMSCLADRADYIRKIRAGNPPGRPRSLAHQVASLLEVVRSEGGTKLRTHRVRERNRQLVSDKKRVVMQQFGRLSCEACGFDFEKFYRERGKAFAECHHRVPISAHETRVHNTVDALAIVCANCHRMLHRRPWITVEELAAEVERFQAGQA